MKNLTRALGVVSLSLCFVLQPAIAQTQSGVVDSDEFFRRAAAAPTLRDHSHQI
jgi:hypothetical protein